MFIYSLFLIKKLAISDVPRLISNDLFFPPKKLMNNGTVTNFFVTKVTPVFRVIKSFSDSHVPAPMVGLVKPLVEWTIGVTKSI